MAQPERAADGQDEIANFDIVAAANAGRNQRRRLHRQHGNIGGRIGQNTGWRYFAAIGQFDFDAFDGRPFDDMAIGEHVELVVVLDNSARACFFDGVAAIAAGGFVMFRIDMHHGGLGDVDDLSQHVGFPLQMLRFDGQLLVFLIALLGRRCRFVPLSGSYPS